MSDVSLSSDEQPEVNNVLTEQKPPENDAEKQEEPAPACEDAKDNISVTTDWETDSGESSEQPEQPEKAKEPIQKITQKKQTPKEKSAARATDKEDVSSESEQASYINHKGRIQKARERAFKKLDLGANDPNLAKHMTDRRELARKLEEDPVFRKKYIKEQERLRKEAEENESCVDSAEMANALKHISKLQGGADTEPESDQDRELSHMEGISDDGSVHASYFESQESKKKSKKQKQKRGKGRSGIYIRKLVVKNLVLNF